jgi:DNA-binding MarR family transcriptional regulator
LDNHSRAGSGAVLDPVIHPIQRLRICALLDPVTEEEFSALRDLLDMSDSALSKQLSTLVNAGYIRQRHATRAGRRRVWLRLTTEGRVAFAQHVAALHDITSTITSSADARG